MFNYEPLAGSLARTQITDDITASQYTLATAHIPHARRQIDAEV